MSMLLHPPPLSLPSDQDASGRTLGAEEIAAVANALGTGTLTSTKGAFVRTFEERFARQLGVKHALACSSGSAAVHTALAALDLEPGDEVITTPITDMGALAPILYQSAIPVFADVDPATCMIDANTIRARLSDRTRALIVTHLFGRPSEMVGIRELAQQRGLPIIEDCAQAFMARSAGQMVGTLGQIGCFSLQQGKHITTGEGGLVVTNDDALARRMFLFINKAWGYGDAKPDHYFLALNYRLSELQGAVAVAQLDKLDDVVRRRTESAVWLTAQLAGLAGITAPRVPEGDLHTYWKYTLRVDPSVIPGGAVALAAVLKERGISSAPRYIQKPAFDCAVFREQKTFGQSRWPFTLARSEAVDYKAERFPGTYQGLDEILVLPWNEKYTSDHLAFLAVSVHDAVRRLMGGTR